MGESKRVRKRERAKERARERKRKRERALDSDRAMEGGEAPRGQAPVRSSPPKPARVEVLGLKIQGFGVRLQSMRVMVQLILTPSSQDSSQVKFTSRASAMCSGSKAGSYVRLVDFVSLNSRLENNREEEEPAITHTILVCSSLPHYLPKSTPRSAQVLLREAISPKVNLRQ